jgi:hypothetical protein
MGPNCHCPHQSDAGLIWSSAGAGEEAPLADAPRVEAETELLRERERPLLLLAMHAAGDLFGKVGQTA